MTIPFEKLWEECEKRHQESVTSDSIASILEELKIKIDLYKSFEEKAAFSGLSIEERKKIKSRTMGEILFTLTNLSLKENINVYESLYVSLKQHS